MAQRLDAALESEAQYRDENVACLDDAQLALYEAWRARRLRRVLKSEVSALLRSGAAFEHTFTQEALGLELALVAAGGSIFTATASGMTPLHAACEGGRAEFVEYLLKTAAEQDAAATSEQIAAGAVAGVSKICNAKDADGKLPFDLAMAGKHKAVVTHLKGAGDPNAQSASCVIS